MPRSKSPRKYKSHKDHRKQRRGSRYRDESSYSRSRSRRSSYHRRGDRDRRRNSRHRRSNRYRDDYKNRRRYERSSSSERSRDRSSSGYYRKKRHSRRYSDKYERSERKRKYRYHNDSSRDASSPSKQKKHHKTKVSSDDEKDRSKDAGHFKHREGTIIHNKYRICKHLGDGTFGRVVEVEDIQTQKRFAAKVIRAVKRYVESALTEVSILQDINKKDPNDEHKIVRLYDAFFKYPDQPSKEQNYFMIFEKLGMSLYDVLKKNLYKGFSIELVQSFARQVLISVGFMHSIELTHTDLKPENILLVNDEFIEIKPKQNSLVDDRSSTRSSSEETKYYKPKYDAIKIIDMGGATYDHDHHSSVINTRQYRAPEVMLGCWAWGHESDVWSIGCILLELYSGDLFFETHETYEHLAMIDKACGPIPYQMANRAESKIRNHFILEESYFRSHETYFDWPRSSTGMESTKRVKNMRMINDVIPSRYPEFRDLIKKMLVINPKERITCKDALEHPFFKVQYTNEDE